MKSQSSVFWFVILTLGLLAIPSLQFPELIFSKFHLGHEDYLSFFYPIKHRFFSALQQGNVLTLGTNNLLGVNLFSAPHYQLIHPFNILWFFLDHDVAANAQFVLAYLVFGFGCFCWLSSVGFEKIVAFFVPLIVLSSGIVWSMQNHPIELDALSSLPWAFYSVHQSLKLQEKRSGLAAIAWSLCAAICLCLSYISGDPYMWLIGLIYASMLYGSFDGKGGVKKLFFFNLFLATSVLLISWFLIRNFEIAEISQFASKEGVRERFWYSSHPLRILESFLSLFFFPFSSVDYLWYFNLSFGVIACSLLVVGFWDGTLDKYYRSRYLKFFLVATLLIIWVLSWGGHFEFTQFVWKSVWPFTQMRFPERLLKYGLPGICLFLASGIQFLYTILLRKLSERQSFLVLTMIVLLNFFEVQASFINTNTRSIVSIQNPKPPEEFGNFSAFDRIQLCSNGVDGVSAPINLSMHVDVRKWGLNTVRDAESVASPVVKYMTCSWTVHGSAPRWLGISHVLAPFVSEAEHTRVERKFNWKIQAQDQKSNFVLYRINPEATLFAYLFNNPAFESFKIDEYFVGYEFPNLAKHKRFMEAVKNNHFVIDPRYYLDFGGRLRIFDEPSHSAPKLCPSEKLHQLIDIKMESFNESAMELNINIPERRDPCFKWLLIPWGFVPGWRARVDGSPVIIRRVNETVMAVELPDNASKLNFRHWF